jgi:hypothetical protein
MNPTRFLAVAVSAALALALPGAALADECHLSWDIPCCEVPGTDVSQAVVTLTICNCTDESAEYAWSFPDQPPLTFSPATGGVGLAPGECIDIPITITCPTGVPGEAAVFTVVVENLNTGNVFKCQGAIRETGDIKPTPTDPVVPIQTDDPTVGTLIVTNRGADPVNWAPIVEVMPDDGRVRVDPIPSRTIEPAATETVELAVAYAEMARGSAPAPLFYDVIIKWDQDGDGVAEAGSSFALFNDPRGAPCVGDLDGDGVVGASDLAALIGGWGACP